MVIMTLSKVGKIYQFGLDTYVLHVVIAIQPPRRRPVATKYLLKVPKQLALGLGRGRRCSGLRMRSTMYAIHLKF